jgi:dihydroorotate dehydrogenase electron transfer subunit
LRIVRIEGVNDETARVRSFVFRDRLCSKARPGQFVMVWVPGVDEVPMSLSGIGSEVCSISVERVGEATEALHGLRVGDFFGLRGPFGNGFRVVDGRVLVVGGGTGAAALLPLVEGLVKDEAEVTFLLGAKTEGELLFVDGLRLLLSGVGGGFEVATEDGSCGFKGVVTLLAERCLRERRFDMVYGCGPEGMLRRLWVLAGRFSVPFQASLERLMRCAIGICGTCVIGRFRVCRDGPVFTGEQLREVKEEFGVFRRGFDGSKVRV